MTPSVQCEQPDKQYQVKMSYEIKDRVFLVTGAASGIGACMVRILIQDGAKHVAVLDVAEPVGVAFEKELNSRYGSGRVKFFKCDVTDDSQLFHAFDTTIKQYGYIDGVFNNAGIMNDSPNVYKKEILLNYTALVTSTLKCLEVMGKDKCGKGGAVVNIASVAGITSALPLSIYNGTKAAVLHFSRCLGAPENFDRTGVRVMTVCFGATGTSLLSAEKTCGIDQTITNGLMNLLKNTPAQTPESAARGAVDAYRLGASASTWLAQDDEPVVDITQDITDGFDKMASKVNFGSL